MSKANFCPSCGSGLPEDGSFCPYCGKSLDAVPYPTKKKEFTMVDALRLIGAWSSAILLGLLAVFVYIALWISPEIFANIGDRGYVVFLIVPFILNLFVAKGSLAVAFYALILSILVASFILLILRSGNILNEIGGDFSQEASPLFKVGTLFAAVLFFNYLFYFLVTFGGAEPTTPEFGSLEDWRLLFVLMNAAVYEELVSRTLLIGVPLSVMVLLGKREGSWLKPLVGGTGMGDVEKFLIVFSALFFALGHYQGWDLWKLLPTFLAGVAMGYLFVKYGLYASIMFHFSFNFLTAPMVYSDSIIVLVFMGLILIGFLGVGAPFFLLYAKEAVESLTGRSLSFSTSRERSPTETPTQGVEYQLPKPVCPACGQQGAIYDKGSFQCPRCGNRY